MRYSSSVREVALTGKTPNQRLPAVHRVQPESLLIEFYNSIVGIENTHEFNDTFQDLARRATRGAENDNLARRCERKRRAENCNAAQEEA